MSHRTWTPPFATLAMLLAFGCHSEQAAPPPAVGTDHLSAQAMRQDLQQYYQIVVDSWAYLDSKRARQGVDLIATRDALLARVTDAMPRQEFSRLLMQFAASLKDGHSEVGVPPNAYPFRYSWPIGLSWVDNQVVVTNVKYLADNPGISIGDQVVQVDGEPIEPFLQKRMEWTSTSTDGARPVIAVDRLHWSDNPQVALTFRGKDGGSRQVVLPCISGQINYRAVADATVFCTSEVLADDLLYVRIPSFTWNAEAFQRAATDVEREAVLSDAKSQIDQAFAALAQPRGVILDVRNNSGGFELLSIYVAQHLVEGDFVYYTLERRRQATPPGSVTAGISFEQPLPQQPRQWSAFKHYEGAAFDGPLVVLINERCFSTTDNLCAFLQDVRPHTSFVGQPTQGGTGEPSRVGKLTHSEAEIYLCISRIYSPQGRMIEGTGTQPNVLVERKLDDLLSGRDAAKEAAVELLKTRLAEVDQS